MLEAYFTFKQLKWNEIKSIGVRIDLHIVFGLKSLYMIQIYCRNIWVAYRRRKDFAKFDNIVCCIYFSRITTTSGSNRMYQCTNRRYSYGEEDRPRLIAIVWVDPISKCFFLLAKWNQMLNDLKTNLILKYCKVKVQNYF